MKPNFLSPIFLLIFCSCSINQSPEIFNGYRGIKFGLDRSDLEQTLLGNNYILDDSSCFENEVTFTYYGIPLEPQIIACSDSSSTVAYLVKDTAAMVWMTFYGNCPIRIKNLFEDKNAIEQNYENAKSFFADSKSKEISIQIIDNATYLVFIDHEIMENEVEQLNITTPYNEDQIIPFPNL